MPQAHAAFKVIAHKSHLTLIDEDNGVSVLADLDYVMNTLRSSKALKPFMKVIVRDAFGVFDVIDLDGSQSYWMPRGLDAETEIEALKAA